MSMEGKRQKYKAKQNECVLMARVSSRDQELEGYSLPAQVRLLKDYCRRKDLTILKIFEISESASGKKQRELFNEVMQYIADNKLNVLVCEKVDRLTRNFKDTVMIEDWLEADERHEVHLVKDSLIMHKHSRLKKDSTGDFACFLPRTRLITYVKKLIKAYARNLNRAGFLASP